MALLFLSSLVAQAQDPRDEDGFTPLMWAVLADDARQVTQLLAKGAAVNARIKDDRKYFSGATEQRAERLGYDFFGRKRYGKTVLYFAAFNKNPDIIKALLAAGAEVNAKDEDGWTPLHFAAGFTENPDIIKILLAAGAEVDAKNEEGFTPLMWAVLADDARQVTQLLAKGAAVNARIKDDRKPFSYATEQRAKRLGYDFYGWGRFGETVLHFAAFNKNPDIIKILLAAGAEVNAKEKKGKTPLHGAAFTENPDIIKILLAAGADRKAKTNKSKSLKKKYRRATPQKYAKNEGNKDALRVLKEYRRYTSPEAKAQLQQEIAQHQSSIAQLKTRLPGELAAHRTAIAELKAGPPIVAAAKAVRLAEVRRLLAQGADPEAQDIFGNTALSIAKQSRNTQLALLLAGGDTGPATAPRAAPAAASGLSPAMQIDLDLVKVSQAIKAKDYFQATVLMEKIIQTSRQHGLQLPPSVDFKQAQVLHLDGQDAKALAALTRYLQRTGRSGQHYREALQLMATLQQTE